ncbi:MAG: GDP-mannose 4,6-dehydratase [Actinomycetota bacterium]
MNPTRYLITGGAGFIGSHLADMVLRRGDEVILLDNLSTGQYRNVQHLLEGPFAPSVDFRTGSVLDPLLVKRSVDDADVVVHLAASVGVQLIVSRGLETVLNNIKGTEVILEAAARAGKKVLVASTSEIYGKNSEGPLHEDSDRIMGSTFKRRWSYATSKAVDEIFAYEYFREQGLPTIVARLFNCAGPRQTGAYGMVVPRLVHQALVGEDLTVYGSGTQMRCFCHVHDTVDGLIRLLESDAAVGDVFNIGSENETTIRDLADLVIELTGSSSGVRLVPYSEAYEPGFEDMERRYPDISKIGRVTGWAPTRSLEQIVRDVAAYELEQQQVAAEA